ncbi:MAG TPA: hypothetical protein EYQ20_05620 [candidate division Zixibacteria bacterium]|nr:hypothetical protein [candidate division Zixibacteria bacterium]
MLDHLYLSYRPDAGVNENRYLDLVRSIVEESKLTIDQYHYNTVDKLYREGHYYAGFALGMGALTNIRWRRSSP